MMRSISYVLLVFGFISLTACDSESHQTPAIKIKGSDTEYPLVKHLMEEYSKTTKVDITVFSGGTTDGIKALSMMECDIANASRSINESEISFNTQKGFSHKAIVFAIDAIAIITHSKLGIDSLSTLQLARIMDGTYTNWKQLDGPNLPITVFSRNAHSGTYVFMCDQFCKNGFPKNSIQLENNQQVIEKVKTTPGAISYVGCGAIREKSGKPTASIWTMNLYTEGGLAYSPFQELAVIAGEYPLVRPLYQYINTTQNKAINAFIAFELSEKGQRLVNRFGYYPINSYYEEMNKEHGF